MARYTENQVFRISPETFNEIDDWIVAAETSGRNAQFGINALVMLMARTNQAFAMEMSRGPLDAREQMSDAAWKLPVRRITQKYYTGWKVRRLTPGAWLLYNDSREAYFIEFGISPHGTEVSSRNGKRYLKYNRRVRRPVRKLSLIKTMRFIDQTKAVDRTWSYIFGPFRPGARAGHAEALAGEQVQSYSDMRNF